MRLIFFLVFTIFIFGCKKTSKPDIQELDKRIELTKNRLLYGSCPSFDNQFILADIIQSPDYRRRFDDFSGDLSGRYISSMTLLSIKNQPKNFHKLVYEVMKYQKKDGRFGKENLVFSSDSISKAHMALLWGNGRMLVGLIDFYNATKDDSVKKTAIKLGDFLSSVLESCSNPKVIKRLEGFGAYGFICFTQITESFVILNEITKNPKYLSNAKTCYKLLQPRGNQHSHGYLLSLRGVLRLYEHTKNKTELNYVKIRFDSILNSSDYLIYGGVAEYFGNKSPYGPYDEGCSEVDFTLLAFQLWKNTGDIKYLEKGEYCFLNQFFHNQFNTGEFGHHRLNKDKGFKMDDNIQKSWWCCTMHGLFCMIETKKNIITEDKNKININLFLDIKSEENSFGISIIKNTNEKYSSYTIDFNSTINKSIAIRKPSWAKAMEVKLNGLKVSFSSINNYIVLNKISKGDKITISFIYKLYILNTNKKEIYSDSIISDTTGYIIYGPWLMGADQNIAEPFICAPSYKNIIIWNDSVNVNCVCRTFNPESFLEFNYIHQDFPGIQKVILRPLSEQSFEKHTNVTVLFNIKKNK